MNDIQHLIDRYLADPTMNPRQSPADFERLSRAVHRDDAPEEWLVIRDMIDALTDGEEDYDLLVAARLGAARNNEIRLVPAFLMRLAAACVLLFVVIGAAIHLVFEGENEIAEVGNRHHEAASDTVVSLVETSESTADPSGSVREADNSASTAATAKITAKVSAVPTEIRLTETPHTDSPLPSATDVEEKSRPAAPPASVCDVPERRIYSSNLLDQIPEE